MDLNLSGRTALVSGSTAGIGYATSEALAALGARVILNGRSQERVDAALARLTKSQPEAKAAPMVRPGDTPVAAAFDLSRADGVAAIVAAYPHVDILVNNLGVFEPVAFESIDDAAWFRFFETNVMSGVRLSRAYLPGMRHENWGRIIFVSSESGVNIPVEMVHYGMTKAAQLAVARGIAEGVAGTGITVNSVLPGPTRSEGVADFVSNLARSRGIDDATMEREFFATARPSSLIKRFATVEEVANMIAYLCTPAASATTGSAVRVDGGVVRSIV
jgi:NAD(P)-dependent dehydrogenase (short-subunit alcohol dehydrogenase family)